MLDAVAVKPHGNLVPKPRANNGKTVGVPLVGEVEQ